MPKRYKDYANAPQGYVKCVLCLACSLRHFSVCFFPLRRVEKREGARDGVAAGGSLSRY